MTYVAYYQSPLGGITISSNGNEITGLWFDGQKYFGSTLPKDYEEKALPVFEEIRRWLTVYFSGKVPDFANRIAKQKGLESMSAQAVGNAIAHNAISLIIPCHRVVGTNGNLTGYAGGMEKKIWLLTMEKAEMSTFFIPEKGPRSAGDFSM